MTQAYGHVGKMYYLAVSLKPVRVYMCYNIFRAMLCFALVAFATVSGGASTLRYITTTDGLTFGSVTTIMQDPAGMMWFGTID